MMPNYGIPPVALTRGKGCQVWDADGREYTDLIAGIAVSALGHAHPAITEAVTRQVNSIAHTSNLFLHEGEIALAERLLGLLGSGGNGATGAAGNAAADGPGRPATRPARCSCSTRSRAGSAAPAPGSPTSRTACGRT